MKLPNFSSTFFAVCFRCHRLRFVPPAIRPTVRRSLVDRKLACFPKASAKVYTFPFPTKYFYNFFSGNLQQKRPIRPQRTDIIQLTQIKKKFTIHINFNPSASHTASLYSKQIQCPQNKTTIPHNRCVVISCRHRIHFADFAHLYLRFFCNFGELKKIFFSI